VTGKVPFSNKDQNNFFQILAMIIALRRSQQISV